MRATIGTELLRKLPPAPCDVRDTKLTGFVLRVRPSGKHSYLVSLGRGRWHTLGSIETLKPDAARKEARAALTARDKGEDPIEKRRQAKRASLTLATFLDEHYEPWISTHRKSARSTLARLRGVFRDFNGKPIAELTPWLLERWRAARLKAGRKPGTVNRDLAALKAALNRAAEWKLVPAHSLREVKLLPEDKIGRLRFLSSAEEARLRKALEARDAKRQAERARANSWRRERGYAEWPAFGAYSDNLSPIVLVALNTGLRFGELTALEWSDVDLTRALLTVRSESAKSGRARHVPLNTEAVRVLQTWKPDPAPESGARVFPGRDGEQLQDIKSSWAPLLKAAKVSGFRFHDLRHTFASKLVQVGVDLNTVRELLGHADIKMTLRYAHLAPEHRAAAVAKLVSR